ncbi:hypothetical protein CFP56_042952 [Quercus suber]|uniref:Replication factor A C-terminal domain-containing protein n=1 Tax=Quercus suber TaxID=58331 RepID=A0AAW0LKV3_QUESU
MIISTKQIEGHSFYRLQVQVQDDTSSTTYILFDKGAEKIISKTTKELAETQEEIQRIIGNECFFQLHLDEYNLKYGRENYTVLKILEMEILHKVEGHQVIIKLKSISSICITPKYHRIHNYSLHGISSMLYILFIEIEAYTLHLACYMIYYILFIEIEAYTLHLACYMI